MVTVAIIQARMGSTRLPGKVMELIEGRPMLSWVVDAVRHAKNVDKVVIAFSNNKADDKLIDFCEREKIVFGKRFASGEPNERLSFMKAQQKRIKRKEERL